MKYLFASFFLLSAILCLTQSATVQETRDELLRRASYLVTVVSGEVKLLKLEEHTLQAEGLALELEQLIQLELNLRATQVTNVTESEINGLNNALQAIEERIAAQLLSLGRQFYSRAEVQQLIRWTNELILRVSEEVQRLKSANRSIEALGLEHYEVQLIQLEIGLRASQRPEEIRRLEELLIEANYRVFEIINGLDKTSARKKRDLKDDVLQRADELILLANNAITALTQQRRPNAVELIQRILTEIQLVVTDLKNSTSQDVVLQLEQRLLILEEALVEDLDSVGRAVGTQEQIKVLITWAEGLRQWALVEIEALKKENQTAEIAGIEEEERIIAGILAELQNASAGQAAAILRLERRLSDAEFRLFEHLTRLTRPEAYRRQLIRIAEELAVRVQIEIRNLTQQNRTLEADGLWGEVTQLVEWEAQLRDAVTNEEIKEVEAKLQAIEERIYAQLRELGTRVPSKRHHKELVVKEAEEFIAIAQNASKILQQQNRTNAVQLIQSVEQQLSKLLEELKAVPIENEPEVNRLEELILIASFQLADDLRRVGLPINLDERKDLLITAANYLFDRIAIEIANLTKQNRTGDVIHIQNAEKRIASLVAEIQNATLVSDLTRLEQRLIEEEAILYEELRLLGQPVITRQELERLLIRAEELSVQILIEVRKLRASGRILLAEGLLAEERELIRLDVDLRTAVTPAEIARVEQRLSVIEQRVAQELARISGTSS